MTVLEGGSVLFGDEAARRAAGSYVPFVLWFNFLAGFAYVAAGTALSIRARWSVGLSFAILFGTAAVFLAFGLHVLFGGPYELRTVAAMTLRTTVWLLLALWRAASSGRASNPQEAGHRLPTPPLRRTGHEEAMARRRRPRSRRRRGRRMMVLGPDRPAGRDADRAGQGRSEAGSQTPGSWMLESSPT